MKKLIWYSRKDPANPVDITELAADIKYTTSLSQQPGTLEVFLSKDPSGSVNIELGDVITFEDGDWKAFKGYIFTLGTDRDETHRIVAYDQLRYLMNEITFVVTGKKDMGDEFKELCKRAGLKNYNVESSVPEYIVPAYFKQNSTIYAILEELMMRTTLYRAKKATPELPTTLFFVKDVFGVLTLTDTSKHLSDLILGDGSLVTSYTCEETIDKETYNSIQVFALQKSSGNTPYYENRDEEGINKWGLLQKTVEIPFVDNDEEGMKKRQKDLAAQYFKAYGTTKSTTNISALGVSKLVAGSGFKLSIKNIELDNNVIINNITHTYTPDLHTMEIGVWHRT